MPLYKHDIFISYCHKDNPQDEGQKGWISNFHSALARRLKELGLDPKIWRDETEIRGHDYFASVTMKELRKAKILVTILTPNYIHSQWCTDERQEFCKSLQYSKDVCIGYQSRIFKIIKIPVPLDEQPAEIRPLIGYEFYKIDEKGYSIELTRDPNSPYFNDYIKKLNYVAHDIVSLLDTINKKTTFITPPAEKTIYLAETTSGRKEDWESIRSNFEDKGYFILPDIQLPLRLEDGNIRDAVRDFLKHCKISVHLMGNRYGPVPEGEEKSIIEIQNDLAAEQAQNDPRFHHVIWIPNNLNPEKRQAEFIEDLTRNKPIQPSTKIVKSELEDLKTEIQDILNEINTPVPPPKPEGPARIYLMYDHADLESIDPIDDCLFHEGFEVLKLPSEENGARLINLHRDYLCLCDAMFIYYDRASKSWLEYKLNDLRKATGYGRKKPFSASIIYVTGQRTQDKERFRTHEAKVIKHFKPFSRDVLLPVISEIQGAAGGSQ